MNIKLPIEEAEDPRFRILTQRYTGATPESLLAVLCPLLVSIKSIDSRVERVKGQNHWRATFVAPITEENRSVLQRGRTGKFVPGAYVAGDGLWKEICKGRIIGVDYHQSLVTGEIYTGKTKSHLEEALKILSINDFLEIGQYGAAAKVLSGLAEYFLAKNAKTAGYTVTRMPEDMAKHLGFYANFDFMFRKGNKTKKVEVKSLWGTNTDCARLIHSKTKKPNGPQEKWTPEQNANYYPTSSCRFKTQDIFAVSLFLRTGNIQDFAFARSVPEDEFRFGLPRCEGYPDHVSQNPVCEIGNCSWFATIDEVWSL